MWPFVAIYVPKIHGDIPPSLMVLFCWADIVFSFWQFLTERTENLRRVFWDNTCFSSSTASGSFLQPESPHFDTWRSDLSFPKHVSYLEVLAEEPWILHNSHFFRDVILSNEGKLCCVGWTQPIVRVLWERLPRHLYAKWTDERCGCWCLTFNSKDLFTFCTSLSPSPDTGTETKKHEVKKMEREVVEEEVVRKEDKEGNGRKSIADRS